MSQITQLSSGHLCAPDSEVCKTTHPVGPRCSEKASWLVLSVGGTLQMIALGLRGDFLLMAEPARRLEEGEKKVCGDEGGGSDGQHGEENGPRVPGLALPCWPAAWWTLAESCHLSELVSCSGTRG